MSILISQTEVGDNANRCDIHVWYTFSLEEHFWGTRKFFPFVFKSSEFTCFFEILEWKTPSFFPSYWINGYDNHSGNFPNKQLMIAQDTLK